MGVLWGCCGGAVGVLLVVLWGCCGGVHDQHSDDHIEHNKQHDQHHSIPTTHIPIVYIHLNNNRSPPPPHSRSQCGPPC